MCNNVIGFDFNHGLARANSERCLMDVVDEFIEKYRRHFGCTMSTPSATLLRILCTYVFFEMPRELRNSETLISHLDNIAESGGLLHSETKIVVEKFIKKSICENASSYYDDFTWYSQRAQVAFAKNCKTILQESLKEKENISESGIAISTTNTKKKGLVSLIKGRFRKNEKHEKQEQSKRRN